MSKSSNDAEQTPWAAADKRAATSTTCATQGEMVGRTPSDKFPADKQKVKSL